MRGMRGLVFAIGFGLFMLPTVQAATVLGSSSGDTFKPSFFSQASNANRIIQGLNAYGSVPINGTVAALPAAGSFNSISITNGDGTILFSNLMLAMPAGGFITNNAGGSWNFAATPNSNRV